MTPEVIQGARVVRVRPTPVGVVATFFGGELTQPKHVTFVELDRMQRQKLVAQLRRCFRRLTKLTLVRREGAYRVIHEHSELEQLLAAPSFIPAN